ILSWVCIVLGGRLIIELAPGLGSLGPWLGGAAYIIPPCIALLAPFLGGKCLRIGLLAPPPPPAAAATPADAAQDSATRHAAPASPAAAPATGPALEPKPQGAARAAEES